VATHLDTGPTGQPGKCQAAWQPGGQFTPADVVVRVSTAKNQVQQHHYEQIVAVN